jgi:glyoxylase-like metal-dependent hydrolase (beta-lactamase superfamily II)
MTEQTLIHVKGPVWLVQGERKGRFPRCHGVLIRDKETALIDPGSGPEPLRRLLEEVTPEVVLCTHTHLDHCSQAHMFPRADILVPSLARESAGQISKMAKRFVPETLAEQWERDLVAVTGYRDFQATGYFDHYQSIRIGDTVLEVIPAPGHTVDHCLFFLPQWGMLISADLDLTSFGPWYGNPESDLEQLRESIQRAKDLRPSMVVSAHRRPVSENLEVEFQNYEAVLDRRNDQLCEFLSQERPWPEVVNAHLIYGKARQLSEEVRDFFEERMLVQHLAELMAQGRVERGTMGYHSL